MVVNIKVVRQTYNQRLEENTDKWERTDYTYEKEQTKYTYEKEQKDYIFNKAKIREIYVRITEEIFGMDLSHNFLKLLHKKVCKPNY